MTGRSFIKRAAIGAVLFSTGPVYAGFVEPRRVEVTRTQISVVGLPDELDGFRILQMSDFHHSRFVSAGYLEKCVKLANSLGPDLIALTGDFITEPRYPILDALFYRTNRSEVERYLQACAVILSRLSAPHGVYATLGNHDARFDADKVASVIRQTGLRLLQDESVTLRIGGSRLQVVGLRDSWSGKVDLERAFAGIEPTAPTVVLMHSPDLFADAARYGPDLILAGHTHGGQVALPLIGPPLIPSRFGAKYTAGLFKTGKTQMYVNRGLGVVAPPVRLGARPEIAVLELKRADIWSQQNVGSKDAS